MATSRPALIAAVIGVLLAALTVAWSGRDGLTGLHASHGDVRLEADTLVLPAGSWVQLGAGSKLELDADLGDATVDLAFGDPLAPTHFARLDGDATSIHGGDGGFLSPRELVPFPGGETTFELDCGPPLLVTAGGFAGGVAEPARGAGPTCAAEPAVVRAVSEVRVSQVRVDGVPVALSAGPPDWVGAAIAVGVGLGTLAVLGPAALGLGILAPALLLFQGTAIPPIAVLWLLYAAACSMRVMEGGWRRWAALALSIGGVVLGVWTFVASLPELGTEAVDADNELVAQALQVTVGIDAYQAKVDDAVALYRPKLEGVEGPLVVTLGSSSSGGNQPDGFWPDHLGRGLPDAHVQTLAWGGSTSWHMRELLLGLDVRPQVCVLYMGHNDTLRSAPGRSIQQIADEAPAAEGFVAPVSHAEAAENVRVMADRCGAFLLVPEYSVGREDEIAAWRDAILAEVDVQVHEVVPLLSSRPLDEMMVDNIHPSLEGQELMGEELAAVVAALLEEQVDER